MDTEEQDINAFVKDLQPGRIYFVSYGGNTCIVARYKGKRMLDLLWFSQLHYWNGFETYRADQHSVTSGITEIREATKPEKHNLFRHETDNNTL